MSHLANYIKITKAGVLNRPPVGQMQPANHFYLARKIYDPQEKLVENPWFKVIWICICM